ncbi:MAG: FlgD immunoglobulin-like domain containing protein [bacterium]
MELQKNLLKIAGLIFIYLSATSSMALAGTATVSWDANTENDLAGYKVYYGDSPNGNYPDIIDVGNVTSITIDNLTEGTTYYFVVTAYDVSGNESGFSQEVSATISSGGDNNTNLPPKLLSVAPMGETQIDVIFNEALDQTSAENPSNYTIDLGIQVIGAILGTSKSIVHLITTAHERGLEYVLSVQNVKDQEGAQLASGSFVQYTIPPIDEKDSTPPTLLYVVITDETHLDVIFNEPVQSNSAETFGNYSITNNIRVLDATLNNNQSVVHLITSEHQRGQDYRLTVNGIEDVSGNAMQSSSKDYRLESSDGGDSGDTGDTGDTGGNTPPTLVSVEFQGSTQIDVTFSEPLDKASAENVNNYSINNNIEVKAAILSANSVTVHLLTSKHDETEEYTLVVRNIQSASGVAVSAGSGITYSKSGDDGIGAEPEPAFSLLPNWPNPFNPETQIRFYLEKGRKVELKIYNAIGQHIRTLVTGDTAPGFHSLIWDGTNTDGLQVPSGVYLYTLEVKREVQKGNLLVNVSVERRVRKMTLIR